MSKKYFSAEVNQEYLGQICKRATDLGVPKENIILRGQGCGMMCVGVYIKFDDEDVYKEFMNGKIAGIVETW